MSCAATARRGRRKRTVPTQTAAPCPILICRRNFRLRKSFDPKPAEGVEEHVANPVTIRQTNPSGKIMNKLLKTTLIASAVLLAGAAHVRALETNLVQTINISITAYAAGDPATNASIVTTPLLTQKATSKEIIALIGDAMGVIFSTKAKLLLISQLPDGNTTVVVQDGTNRTDVSGFFDVSNDTTVG